MQMLTQNVTSMSPHNPARALLLRYSRIIPSASFFAGPPPVNRCTQAWLYSTIRKRCKLQCCIHNISVRLRTILETCSCRETGSPESRLSRPRILFVMSEKLSDGGRTSFAPLHQAFPLVLSSLRRYASSITKDTINYNRAHINKRLHNTFQIIITHVHILINYNGRIS